MKKAVQLAVFMAAALGAGLAIGKLMGGRMARAPLPVPGPLLFLLFGLVMFLVLLAHETGHIVGGVSAGFRFQLLTVGPFTLVREDGRLRLRANRDLGRAGGIAVTLPVPGVDVRRGAMRMIVGGPLASLVLGILGWVVFFASSGLASLLGALTGGFSLGIALMTSIPGAIGGYVSDGGRFLMLRRSGMEAERWLTLGRIRVEARPRDWDLGAAGEEWVDGSVDGVIVASALYCYELDCGREEAAGRWLDRMISYLDVTPPYMRPGVLVEAAWFTAARRGRAAEGRKWLEQVKVGPYVQVWSLRRAEWAVLRAEGRLEEAEEKRREALGLMGKAAPSGATAFELDLMG